MAASKYIALILPVVCTFSVVGCATAPKKAEVDANGKPIEYVWVTPTGSHVPVKVPKDQAAAYQSYTAKDQETMRRLEQQSAQTPKNTSGSGGP